MNNLSINGIKRRERGWRQSFSMPLVLALAVLLVFTGCATPPSALALLPVTGASGAFQVHEYAITEQSTDNPTSSKFQQRVQAAVTSQSSGWHFHGLQDLVKNPNQSLAQFHYRLEINPSPPFSAFALYRNDPLVQRDIARFWPISLKSGASGPDFLLALETLSGQKLVASQDGIHAWMDEGGAAGNDISRTPPVYFGDQIAYAETSGDKVIVYSGTGLLYSGAANPGKQARNLNTWNDSNQQHWALEMDGRVILDGKDLNQAKGYTEIFNWQLINGQPFYFYSQNGSYHLSYAGKNLPVSYDKIIHNNNDNTAMFNPGSTGSIVWFYALRDGLWYYVEVGNFNEP